MVIESVRRHEHDLHVQVVLVGSRHLEQREQNLPQKLKVFFFLRGT